jgi:hypothetical protein
MNGIQASGQRRADVADASLDTNRIAFMSDCQVWSNNSVCVAMRNASPSTVNLAATSLAVRIMKGR